MRWGAGLRGGRRGRAGISCGGFRGLAGAEGVEDAPFAGAAAEVGGIELAEGEFDLVPGVADEAVRAVAEGDHD